MSDFGDSRDLSELADLIGIIYGCGFGEPVETLLLRRLAQPDCPLPAYFIEWLVTGNYRRPEFRYDFVRVRGDYLQ